MGNIKEINIKNRKYYFLNDMIDIKNFDSSLLKIDKKSYKNIGIYNIGYITIKKKWWLWKNSQCKSFLSDDWWSNWTYRRKLWK